MAIMEFSSSAVSKFSVQEKTGLLTFHPASYLTDESKVIFDETSSVKERTAYSYLTPRFPVVS